jgi:hypothetical protein
VKLIVFVGPRGSGKDTCASIVQEMGVTDFNIKFAGPLKDICSDVFGISRHAFEDPIAKEAVGYYRVGPFEIGQIVELMTSYVPVTQKGQRDALRAFANHVGTVLTTPRQVLQYVGTEMIRAVDNDWHCKAAIGLDSDVVTAVVTDCRFENEYDYLMQHHEPEFYYVERPLAEAQLNAATHESERQVAALRKRIDKVIHNTGTVDDLRMVLRGVFQ